WQAPAGLLPMAAHVVHTFHAGLETTLLGGQGLPGIEGRRSTHESTHPAGPASNDDGSSQEPRVPPRVLPLANQLLEQLVHTRVAILGRRREPTGHDLEQPARNLSLGWRRQDAALLGRGHHLLKSLALERPSAIETL